MDGLNFDLKAEELKISGVLKGFILCTALLGLLFFVVGFPEIEKSIIEIAPEIYYLYKPWLIFAWTCAVPYFIILFFAWKISDNIGREKAFSHENEILFRKIYITTAIGTAYFLLVNLIFLLLNVSHPGIMITAVFIVFAGSAFAFCAKVLGKMCSIAATLKEQNELTI